MKCPVCYEAELNQDNTKTQFSFRCPDCNFNDGHAMEAINYAYLIIQLMSNLDEHPSLIVDGKLDEFNKAKDIMLRIYHESGNWQDNQKWDFKQ